VDIVLPCYTCLADWSALLQVLLAPHADHTRKSIYPFVAERTHTRQQKGQGWSATFRGFNLAYLGAGAGRSGLAALPARHTWAMPKGWRLRQRRRSVAEGQSSLSCAKSSPASSLRCSLPKSGSWWQGPSREDALEMGGLLGMDSEQMERALPESATCVGRVYAQIHGSTLNQSTTLRACSHDAFPPPFFRRKSGVYLFACEERPQTPLCDWFAQSALPFASRPLAFSLFFSLSHLSNACMCLILLRAGDHVFQKSVYSADAPLP